MMANISNGFKKVRVTIIEGCDFESFPTGGVLPFLHNCLLCENIPLDIKLIGLSTDRQDRIGKWRECKIGAKNYPFLPVAFCSKETAEHPSLVPNRAKMLAGLFVYLYKVIKACDVIYVHSPELALPFVMFSRSKKVLIHVHGIPDYAAMNSRYAWVRKSFYRKLYHKSLDVIFKRADKVIWVSKDGLSRSSQFSGLAEKSIIIPTSVDTAMFVPMDKAALRVKYKIPADIKLIGFLGRLNNSKRPELLLDAYSSLVGQRRDVGLLYIGDGELRRELEAQSKKAGFSERIYFSGKIKHSLVPEYINLVDVGCLPSKAGEGFPLTVLEFLACGVPVVASNLADIASVIKDQITGFLVKSGSAIEFAEKISSALDAAPHLRSNCINMANEYSADKIGSRVFEEVARVAEKCSVSNYGE